MIRDFTSKKNREKNGFCRLKVLAPDGRFTKDDIVGGLTYKSANHEAKQIDPCVLIQIFDSNL